MLSAGLVCHPVSLFWDNGKILSLQCGKGRADSALPHMQFFHFVATAFAVTLSAGADSIFR